LWAIWRFGTDPDFTRISMEFMALANHRKEMRAEIAYYAERFRKEQHQAVTAALQRYGVDSQEMPPVVFTVLMTSLSRFLVLEQAIGVSGGHAETLELVENYLRRLEGEPQPIAGIPPAWVVHQFRSEQSTPLGPSLDTTTAPSTDRSQ
jgi:hypothetical protein